MRLTLPRDKVLELLEHAEGAPSQRVTLEQAVTPANWRDDIASFGGDDGTEFIPAEAVRAYLPDDGDLILDVTPDAISLVPPAARDEGPSPA